ncbi:MAG: phosphatase PAP2 family protein [Candidatus Marinimicrobia bacterium]|nr:phosphatase PAP2 family protein [Candidatus Neomarinimicrobiota bacterium]MCF7830192.1 phosphatase PAP2 family protein [Candidatus Neomarinimicrobiota bacterium]MCF7882074.1 phosphatase PAP2 family protein [Candidatus Neomarinimicrobiota bacterium]
MAYAISPLHWEKTGWVSNGARIAGVGAVSLVDESIRSQMRDWRGNSNHWSMRSGRVAGSKYTAVSLSSGMYLVGLFGEFPSVRVTGRLLMEGYVAAGATTTILKTLIGRHRPYTDDGVYVFTPPGLESPSRALPSGHSTTGWVTATVLAKRTDNTLADVLYYSGATLISVSRIYHDKHWLSDVVAGAFVGYASGAFVVRKERERQDAVRKNNSKMSFSVHPQPGITLRWQF